MRSVPLVNTRALGNAFLVQKPAIGQQQPSATASSASPARAALEEAKRLHRSLGARYEDLVALVGQTKADIMVGQAAQAVEAAKAAMNA